MKWGAPEQTIHGKWCFCKSFQAFIIYCPFLWSFSSVSISPSVFLVLSSVPLVPVVTRATALTWRPMFLWTRGPLGASQWASLPATSGAGGLERALVSALKVNKAAAQHSASDSVPPDQTRPDQQTTSLKRRLYAATHRCSHCPGLSANPGCNSKLALHIYPVSDDAC